MSLRSQLHAYIAQLEKRLRWSTLLRGAAILTGSALIATLVFVIIANARAFSEGSVTGGRLGLIVVLALAAGAGLAMPLRRLTRRREWEPRKLCSAISTAPDHLHGARRSRSLYRAAGGRDAGRRPIGRAEADGYGRAALDLAGDQYCFAGHPDLADRRRPGFYRLWRVASVDRSA